MEKFVKHIPGSQPVIPMAELHALASIKKLIPSESVMYVFNAGQTDSFSSYVSALSGHDTFLAGQVILTRHGVDYGARQELAGVIASSTDSGKIASTLKQNKIQYLYAYKPHELSVGLSMLPLRKIFENDRVIVFTYENN
jgi:hypothetical protein